MSTTMRFNMFLLLSPSYGLSPTMVCGELAADDKKTCIECIAATNATAHFVPLLLAPDSDE